MTSCASRSVAVALSALAVAAAGTAPAAFSIGGEPRRRRRLRLQGRCARHRSPTRRARSPRRRSPAKDRGLPSRARAQCRRRDDAARAAGIGGAARCGVRSGLARVRPVPRSMARQHRRLGEGAGAGLGNPEQGDQPRRSGRRDDAGDVAAEPEPDPPRVGDRANAQGQLDVGRARQAQHVGSARARAGDLLPRRPAESAAGGRGQGVDRAPARAEDAAGARCPDHAPRQPS